MVWVGKGYKIEIKMGIYWSTWYWKGDDKEFIDADKIILRETSSETVINSEAIYTSRFMSFSNLSKPINSTRVQIEDPEGMTTYNSIILIYIY